MIVILGKVPFEHVLLDHYADLVCSTCTLKIIKDKLSCRYITSRGRSYGVLEV